MIEVQSSAQAAPYKAGAQRLVVRVKQQTLFMTVVFLGSKVLQW
jgi:hypothetical protein